jgi:hypothetical protein
MTTFTSDSDKTSIKEGMPVMPCHPTEGGGVSGQLVRALPINPRQRRKESRRMSIKKFFRCTPEEDKFIKASAADAGMEQASYMRIQCIGASKMRKARRIRADWDELRRCMGVINKAGNVVNQLVLLLRRGSGYPDAANAALMELCKAARAIMAALGKS